jgi:gas vesicle protein
MFRRRSKIEKAKQAVAGRLPTTGEMREQIRDQVAGMTDDLSDALETAREAITKAMATTSRRGAEVGAEVGRKSVAASKEASRKSVEAGKHATRRARGAALDAVERSLPEPDEAADMTRRVAGKFFPERAKQYRKTARKRRRRMVMGGMGLAGLGVAVGWLTAPKRGDETREALKARANAAGDRVAEMRSTTGSQAPAGTQPSPGMGTGNDRASTQAAGTSAGTSAANAATQPDKPAGQDADVTPIHQADGTAGRRR